MFQRNVSVLWVLLVIFVLYSPKVTNALLGPIEQRLLDGVEPPAENNGASVASIRMRTMQIDVHVGGGFIINKHWVGTAAQCLQNSSLIHTVVAVGSTTISGGIIYTINEIEIHQNYNVLTLAHDIGLVRTVHPIIFDENVQAIPLGAPLLTNYVANMYGWGRTTIGGGLSVTLRSSSFSVVPFQTCVGRFPVVARRFISDDRQTCFARFTGGTCPGDAGGPIIFSNHVIGIISWVEPCVSSQTSVHTRIGFYINWIQRFTRVDD